MTPAWLWYPGLYEQPFQCSLHGGFHQKGRLKHLFPRSEQVSGCSVCSCKEQKKVPPTNFESFSSLVSSSFETPGWFGFPGTCWCRSAASQREPLFPHLFSLSPLMISSDRHDSWINMQTQFGLPPPQNLYYALRFRDEQNMEITMGFCRDLDE